jgi:hypothetical protein
MSIGSLILELAWRNKPRWYVVARRDARGEIQFDVKAAMPGEKPPLEPGEKVVDGPHEAKWCADVECAYWEREH